MSVMASLRIGMCCKVVWVAVINAPMSWVTLYKLKFCDSEAHQSVQGYINLMHTHKYFQVIQFVSLLTPKYEIHDINWLHCIK